MVFVKQPIGDKTLPYNVSNSTRWPHTAGFRTDQSPPLRQVRIESNNPLKTSRAGDLITQFVVDEMSDTAEEVD